MKEATHAYIGVKECGCVVAAVVDLPEHLTDTAKTLVSWSRQKRPLRPERIPIEEARTRLQRCTHGKRASGTPERSSS